MQKHALSSPMVSVAKLSKDEAVAPSEGFLLLQLISWNGREMSTCDTEEQ